MDIPFQHTATRRWLPRTIARLNRNLAVSTHSHPKVAAVQVRYYRLATAVSTHSHPKVAASDGRMATPPGLGVSTHSHPKVAASKVAPLCVTHSVSTHSHPKVAARHWRECLKQWLFQHTATRRWLHAKTCGSDGGAGFNTQPPEGGCLIAWG